MENEYPQEGNAATVIVSSIFALAIGFVGGYFLGKRNGAVVVVPAEQTPENTLFDTNSYVVMGEVSTMAPQFLNPIDPALTIGLQTETLPLEDPIPSTAPNFPKAEILPHIDPPEDTTTHNIFENADPYWNQEAEMSNRSKEAPYVIHCEEYIADEMGYRQTTVTYYAADDILVDEFEVPVHNHAGLMGELPFGHGSNDPNIVYIRNEAIHMEWEVLRDPDSYQNVVLGESLEPDELAHSLHRVLKFRRD